MFSAPRCGAASLSRLARRSPLSDDVYSRFAKGGGASGVCQVPSSPAAARRRVVSGDRHRCPPPLLDAVLNSLRPAVCSERLLHCAWFVCSGLPGAAVRPGCLMLRNGGGGAHMALALVLYLYLIELSAWPENC